MRNKGGLPYSYHTFMYPFSFECEDERVGGILPKEWRKENFYSIHSDSEQYKNQYADHYNLFHYFFPNARENILNIPNICKADTEAEAEHGISREQFIYDLKSQTDRFSDNMLQIVLRSGVKEPCSEKDRTISLHINWMKLSVYYELKIGILAIESEYYHESSVWNQGEEICDGKDIVCLINDYGRRLYSPTHNVNNNFLPEKIIITINGQEKSITDFTKVSELSDICGNSQEPKLINAILNREDAKSSKLKTILDDRMYVTFLIRDSSVCDKNVIGDNEMIYRLAFCDGGELTCQDSILREKKLKEHVYTRWMNWGTLYTVSEYSFGCLTGESEGILPSVITPFLSLYTEMTKIALVQRAAISKLESEAAFISAKREQGNLDDGVINDIRNLWKRYIIFQNEVFMPEVTFQEQGVELYDMLKKFLKLEELNIYLEKKFKNLHGLAELICSENKIKVDDKLTQAINLLTVAGTVFALFSIVSDLLLGLTTSPSWKEKIGFIKIADIQGIPFAIGALMVFVIGFSLMGVIIWVGMNAFDRYMKENKGKEKKPHYWGYYIMVLALSFIMCLVWSLL